MPLRSAVALGWTCLPLCLLGLGGCNMATVPPVHVVDRSVYVANQTRTFPGVNRAGLLAAAEAVVRASGEYEFVYGLNGFSARQPYFVYGVLGSVSGRDRVDFETEPVLGGLRASVTITDAGDLHGSLTVARYETAARDVSLYDRFWSQVERVLGRGAKPVACDTIAMARPARLGARSSAQSIDCAFRDEYSYTEPGRR